MSVLFRAALIGASLSIPACTTVAAQSQSPAVEAPTIQPAEAFADRVERYAAASWDNRVPGIVHVSQAGETLVEIAYGDADRATGRPLTPETVFDIGSLTKQFTAAAIMVLVDTGRLRLDATLGELFADVPADKTPITIHQLLTHSSGLSDETGGFEGNDRGPFIGREAFLSTLFASPLTGEPGARFEYTNAGYSVLAAVIEDVSGQNYETFLKANVLDPAGMAHTGYRQLDWSDETAAHGYFWPFLDTERADQGTFLTRWTEEDVSWHLRGNGGLHSTLRDLMRWHRALQDGAVLSDAALEQYQTPYMPFSEDGAYAYGWGVRATPVSTPVLSHNGGNGIFFAWIARLPEEDVLFVHLTNETRDIVEQVGPNIRDMFFDPALEPSPVPPTPIRAVVAYARANPVEAVADLPAHYEAMFGHGVEYPDIINIAGRHLQDIDRIAALYALNVELFPGDGLLHYSLAETYREAGRDADAVTQYRQSLDLADEADCGWCEPARDALASLGAD